MSVEKPRPAKAHAPRRRIESGEISSSGNKSDNLAVQYTELLKNYSALAEGVRMIRRAAERASRFGLLPPIDHRRKTPLQECESIARAIYRSVRRGDREGGPTRLAGMSSHDGPGQLDSEE
jgi:hypothetical protein